MTFTTTDDPSRVDRDWLWRTLNEQAYWTKFRPHTREEFERSLDNSWRVVSVFDEETGAQVGFARAVSDGVDIAYLADVIVDEPYRGKGVGKLIVKTMIEDGPGANFLHWLLITADAHGLYQQYGFTAPDDMMMWRLDPSLPPKEH